MKSRGSSSKPRDSKLNETHGYTVDKDLMKRDAPRHLATACAAARREIFLTITS
jgi:hypothetical protein